MSKVSRFLLVLLVVCSFLQLNTYYAPTSMVWGNAGYVRFDSKEHVFVNHNPELEAWRYVGTNAETVRCLTQPERVPTRKQLKVTFKPGGPLWRKETPIVLVGATTVALPKSRRRFVLINVEQTADYERQYRTWPHLGMLFVGTAAKNEGWEVVLWDELVQGHCDLDSLVQPGDVVGLSLVVTGAERGILLARWAKELGASMVIVGNDAAAFRANHLLSLPSKPIDVVFTSNSTKAIGKFFRELGAGCGLESIKIPGVQTKSGMRQLSNRSVDLLIVLQERKHLKQEGQFDSQDVFIVPDLGLFPDSYWNEVWSNYRAVFGHKHSDPAGVRNALGLLAQGCTKTAGQRGCGYCTINGVADIRKADDEYVAQTVQRYAELGVTHLFNVTDSSYEMQHIPRQLLSAGSSFKSMTIYGRAQGITQNPELLELWRKVAPERLVVNVGMDSGDEKMLEDGVDKSNPTAHSGSRLEENRIAVRRIKEAGANLHYSLIFGSPGETHDSCKRSLDFMHWTIDVLGTQLDTVESDIWWVNHGQPESQVFESYDHAQELAAKAGKEISVKDWVTHFAAYQDTIVVPWEVEEAWYRFFTNISAEEAQAYNAEVAKAMATVEGSVHGRAFKPAVG